MPTFTKFRVPFYPLIPLLGLLSCIILMFSLPQESWIGVAVVLAVISFLYVLRRKSSNSVTEDMNKF